MREWRPGFRATRSSGLRTLRLARRVLAERRLGGSQAGDRHAERRAGDVVETDLVAERDRGGVAAVLAANAELDVGPHLAAALDRDAHQFADTLAIESDERIDREDTLGRVDAEEARSIVAGNAERRLGEVVGAEREELGGLRDLVGLEAR